MSNYGVFLVRIFGTDIYSVNFLIQSKFGKIRTRKTPYLDNFYAVTSIYIKKLKERSKIIELMRKFAVSLPRKDLLTNYNSFLRPDLDYKDVVYGKPKNKNFKIKIGKV